MTIDFKKDLIETAIEIENAIKEYSADRDTFLEAFVNYAEISRQYLSLVDTNDSTKLSSDQYSELKSKLLNVSIKVLEAVADDRLDKLDSSPKVRFHLVFDKSKRSDIKHIYQIKADLVSLQSLTQVEKIKRLKEIIQYSNQALGRHWIEDSTMLTVAIGIIGILIGAISLYLRK